jgi:hypothetical protein
MGISRVSLWAERPNRSASNARIISLSSGSDVCSEP